MRFRILKAKLSGAKTLVPIALFGMVLGLFLWIGGCSGITPSSVHVSGYYRSNGTYVDSYYRRPPGSVVHDEPYELEEKIGFFIFFGGLFFATKFTHRLFFVPAASLFPEPDIGIARPFALPEFAVPKEESRARKSWQCSRCDEIIRAGDDYRFINRASLQSMGYRFCLHCALQIDREHKQHQNQQAIYVAAFNAAKANQFEKYFGVPYDPKMK